VEVLQGRKGLWYAELIPTRQRFGEIGTHTEQEMQASIRQQFVKQIEPWAAVA
jgi:hypothetical protein